MTLQELLQQMVNKRASDLHVRSGSPPYLRIDGLLSPVADGVVAPQEVETMLDQVVTPRARRIYQEKGECDFSFAVGEVARFRVNAFRQRQNLCLAIRYVTAKTPSFQDLKLPIATMRKIADNRRGLVLVTGVTGAGKSSTLAAMIDYINETRRDHIVTLEDPVEFVHKDKKSIISQRQTGEDTASYADGLRMALRQDPNVIMIGEMRDLETTTAALTAAQTGHLVLGTLHTTDAIQTISRIIDLFPPHQQAFVRMQAADCLRAVVSQRLLPCLKGGRVPAVEILIVTAHVRKLIEEANSSGIIQACAKGQFYGMQTFNQALIQLFKDGLVSEADVLEAATSPDDVKLALRGVEQDVRSS